MTKPVIGSPSWGATLNAHLDTLQAKDSLGADVTATGLFATAAAQAATAAQASATQADVASRLSDATLLASASRRGVLLADYPRTGGETDDSPRLARAIAAAVANNTRTVILGAETYSLASTVTVSAPSIWLIGMGWNTILQSTTNTVMLEVTGDEFNMQNVRVHTSTTARTVYPVRVTGPNRPVFTNVFFSGVTGSWRSGIFFNGGSVGTVDKCLFNHACIDVRTYDVKITNTFVQAMTCEFAISLSGGAGNLTLANVDVVPPLTSTAGAGAAIQINAASLNTKMSDIYLDGNPSLNCRGGIHIKDGAGAVLMRGISANKMDSDCIVIDSAYSVVLDGYTGQGNNAQGNGAREIVVQQTGAQPVEKVRLTNISCLQTTTVTGTTAAAIAVLSPVDGAEVSIEGFDIKQPGGGGAYVNPEVACDAAKTSLAGRGTLSRYSAIGSQAVSSGATSATINLSTPYPMAYRPKASDIHLEMEGDNFPAHRIQFNSDNQIFVGWATALGGAATIHWKVSLRR